MSQPIRLTVRQVSDTEAIIMLDSAQGQADNRFTLPWLNDQEWNTIFLYLDAFRQDKRTWPGPETTRLATELRLATDDGMPSPHRVEHVGSSLYKVVFGDGKFAQQFQRALGSHRGELPIVELHFQDAGRYLQTYPWEVLHDGEDFLFDSRRASLVRYVDFDEPLSPLTLSGELKILMVDPRPRMPESYSKLLAWDSTTLEAMLPKIGGQFQILKLDSIALSTWGNLSSTLNNFLRKIHVIHIDTHGECGVLCEDCGSLNLHGAENCSDCGGIFSEEHRAQGYVAFADRKGNPQWISGKRLGKALRNQGVQMVVLSACSSGLVSGHSVFNSVAGALVKCGIPAVVAMQFSVEVKSTTAFMASFYYGLVNDVPVAHAVASAKTVLLDSEDAWYRPVLYLRTDPENVEGRIFVSSVQEVIADRRQASGAKESTNAELVAELEEWKRIHSDSQVLYQELDKPIAFLEAYCRTDNPDILGPSGYRWIVSCVSKLKSVPGEWNLQHARDPILDQLSEQTSSLDDLIRLFRHPKGDPEALRDRFEQLRSVIWKVLTVADRNIQILIGHLKPTMIRGGHKYRDVIAGVTT